MTGGIEKVTLRTSPVRASRATVSVGMAKGLVQFAVANGADRDALLEGAELDPAAIECEDARIPFARYAALYAVAEVLCNDPALALHFGESLDAMDQLLVCLVGSACGTMGDAIASINQYGRLSVDVDTGDGGDPYRIESSLAGYWLIDEAIYPGNVPQVIETSFTRLIVGTRQLTDRQYLRAVHLVRSAPPHRQEYERILRAPVSFGERRNAMLLEPDWFSLPLGVTSAYAGTVLEAHASRLLDDLDPARRVRRSVEEVVTERLGAADVSMAIVARELGMSRQTLYRHLKSQGTTFEQVVDRIRSDLAARWLRDGASISETAHRLGFSDRSAFSRAFKRWTGRSPRSAAFHG